MTADLSAFLAAVHDADEQAARAAAEWIGGEWTFQPGRPPMPTMLSDADGANPWGYDVGRENGREAAHIARHDPQSVLARVEAERALVALHRPRMFQTFNGEDQELDQPYPCEVCWHDDDEASWPCPTLRALAGGYRYREGWRAEWAPDGVEVGV